MSQDYRTTLHLLETPFPMRGDLAKREPVWLAQWQKQKRYETLRRICSDRPAFILQDGPPYANGKIHLGHAVNKILKDLVIRSKTLAGYNAPFIPGWDCHGLPIELMVEKEYGKTSDAALFRQRCRDYAAGQVASQKNDFMRLGILADWEHPYLTMNPATEANTVRALGRIAQRGFLVQGAKPVHWCVACASSLAEAEVEYQDKSSMALHVAFPVMEQKDQPTYAVIWTTTAWTLPANQAVAAHPDLNYGFYQTPLGVLVLEETLAPSLLEQYGYPDSPCLNILTGRQLEGMRLHHPFQDREVPMILAEYVTAETGTGLVHTAPAHGVDDFQAGLRYHLPLDQYVLSDGHYSAQVPYFAGMSIWQAQETIPDLLAKRGFLLHKESIQHSYPHCWRHRTPTIFRATPQWFISLDLETPYGRLREAALYAIEHTEFFPAWGRNRLKTMVEHRPDWCLSRQRIWGNPIPLWIHKQTGQMHPDTQALMLRVADHIEQQGGIESWNQLSDESLLGEEANQYERITDITDVWFDSGILHFSLMGQETHADLYLEGSDQHRGWFQTSLLTACALYGRAPFNQLLTHGFVVDGQGHKMSKSRGNVVSPDQVIQHYGVDILRLWVASTDYVGELAISDEILKRTAESYRRIRNTLRFLLANLEDFNPQQDGIQACQLVSLDRYALSKMKDLQTSILNNYHHYRFHMVVKEIVDYCSEHLGAFYLDILKDRLYTCAKKGISRRSAQTALYCITQTLLQWLAPILCFTSEEGWRILHNDPDSSPIFSTWQRWDSHQPPPNWIPAWQAEGKSSEPLPFPIEDLSTTESILWKDTVERLRPMVTKAIEEQRIAGHIGSSLAAELTLYVPQHTFHALNSMGEELRFAFLVSQCHVVLSTLDQEWVEVAASHKSKCQRCWHYVSDVGHHTDHPEICGRCILNITDEQGEIRQYV
jgi:isoleucyl-tRNA synthetase